MPVDISKFLVRQDNSILEAIALADSNKCGMVLVVGDHDELIGTVTDGDVRRAILANVDLSQPVRTLLERKADTQFATPITASASAERSELLEMFNQYKILEIPLVDKNNRPVDLVRLDDLIADTEDPLQAVIMAGGFGTRLRPLTEDTPKPMLPVGDRPLMEIMVGQLAAAGITNVNVAVHHNSAKIADHFGDGSRFGVAINYAMEDRPLGTAGALGLLEVPAETTLVINGDILTQVNFRAMLAFHREHNADMTVAVHHQEFEVPYGVVECEGASVRGLTEKPLMGFLANAGIYLLEPTTYQYVPKGESFDMTDLIERLLAGGRPVVAFPIHEYWKDIGKFTDYQQAQEDVQGGKIRS